MNTGIHNGKKISYLLKIIVFISAAFGVFLSSYAGRNSFMGGAGVFMFFTIQSNIAIALICAVGLYLQTRERNENKVWYIIRFVGTVAITLTGFVFVVVLSPTLGAGAWNIQNVLTHVVVPIAAVAVFFVESSDVRIKKINVLYVTVPPLLYAVYAGIGYVQGWKFYEDKNYPYFFLNWGSPAGAFGFTDELPFMGCVWWMLILTVFLIGVGLCYLVMADKINDKRQVGDREKN